MQSGSFSEAGFPHSSQKCFPWLFQKLCPFSRRSRKFFFPISCQNCAIETTFSVLFYLSQTFFYFLPWLFRNLSFFFFQDWKRSAQISKSGFPDLMGTLLESHIWMVWKLAVWTQLKARFQKKNNKKKLKARLKLPYPYLGWARTTSLLQWMIHLQS